MAISESRNNGSSAKAGKSTGAPQVPPFTVESETEMTTLLTFQGQLNTVTTESQATKTICLFHTGGPDIQQQQQQQNPSISQVGVHWVGPNNPFGRSEGEGKLSSLPGIETRFLG